MKYCSPCWSLLFRPQPVIPLHHLRFLKSKGFLNLFLCVKLATLFIYTKLMKYCFRIIHLNRLPIAYIQNCFCWIKLVVRRFLFLVKRRDSKVLIIFFFIHKVCPQIIYISCDCGTSVSDIFTFSERIRNTCFTTIQYDMITGKNRKQLVNWLPWF